MKTGIGVVARLVIFAAVLLLAAVAWLSRAQEPTEESCAALGRPCTKPNTSNPPCCAPNVCSQMSYTCVAPGATTTTTAAATTSTEAASTTTTTTSSSPTTTTPPAPPNNGYSFLYTPGDLGLLMTKFGESCLFSGNIVDPRTGSPADQFLLTAMYWQFEQYSMEMVAAADSVGCTFNDQMIEDSNFKFGGDYVLLHQPYPKSGQYQALLPTYVRQYTCGPIVATAPCLQQKHMLSTDLAQIAGIQSGPVSPPPPGPPNAVQDGMLSYDAGHYAPLTPDQCKLLEAAEDAHHVHDQSFLDHDYTGAAANNQAVLNTQRAFEASARNLDEAGLFKWTWQGNYNRSNPQDVLDGLTRGIISAHMKITDAFNCATGKSPDVGTIMHFRFLHNFLHDCRATTHWLDVPMPTVCEQTQIMSCPRLTCRQQAALL